MARKVNEDVIQKWEELREKQYSYKDIAEKTGWSKRTVAEYLKEEAEPEKQEDEVIKKLVDTCVDLKNRVNTLESEIKQIYEDMPEEPAITRVDIEEGTCDSCGAKNSMQISHRCSNCEDQWWIKYR